MIVKIFLTALVAFSLCMLISDSKEKTKTQYYISLAGVMSVIVMMFSSVAYIWVM